MKVQFSVRRRVREARHSRYRQRDAEQRNHPPRRHHPHGAQV